MSFQEVLLIPRSEYQRHDTTENSALNTELNNINSNKSMPVHEKNTKYIEKLNELMTSNEKVRAPMEIILAHKSTPAPEDEQEDVEENYPTIRIKELLPAPMRKKGLDMYEKVRKLPQVKEMRRSFKINNLLLNHTLLDYVGEALTHKRGAPLSGYKAFVRLLKTAGARSNSFVNRDYTEAIISMSKKKVQKENTLPKNISLNQSLEGSGSCLNKWKRYYFK